MPRTLVEIDRESGEPLYRQVRNAVEHGIAVGFYPPEQPLPSSRELAKELGVSRNTINLAYQELIAEGYVESQQRSGLFVNREMRAHTVRQRSSLPSAPGVDWTSRIRSYPDAGLPHLDKRPDWHRYRYPFPAGQVDVAAFPVRAWSRCLSEALTYPHRYASLQDSVGSDDPMLVDMVCKHLLPARGIAATPEEVLVTVGSQQGLDLLARTLLRPGQLVGVEDPGYLDARHIFLRAGARVHGYPVDSAGLRPPDSLRGVDLLYLTPSHQHPTNATLHIGRRRELVRLAAEAGTILVEDDYDSEFRYQGSPTPALKALDTAGDVVYAGTFSKFLSPGLRLGYLAGPAELIRELRTVRRYEHRHPAGQLQRALALLISSGEYRRALRRYRNRLLRKWTLACSAAREHLPWTPGPLPPGGVSLWLMGPPELSAQRLIELADERDVLIERGDICYLGDPPQGSPIRIGFAATPFAAIEPGVRIIGELARELL
ncbi:GntR family transcriptional regulator [Tamaricihabitans halophyticus]|uniref:GntR family transcriptional regulator n=1 Tax=Tamaricihabitans halophyticus TaxID=1262583 RepID=A0A4R2RCN1_9PSEU|nr:PLP-dependent aminotransferase family protein [Tamaricihabitans halophyticus]TCP57185.1 GntR family transcriptional regulator [Tamaricihabitans halophyticus]